MQNFSERFQDFIQKKFNRSTELDEAINYILFPGGKYFRPRLFFALCEDLGFSDQEKIFDFACFLELHHNYTLIHDDLPCMDDDDLRRGRETIHKKYNEALAVLTGDALLNLSYECLLKCENIKLLKFCTWAMGGHGLIKGQVFDLDGKEKTLNEILRVHELKTSRLMQASLLGAYYLSQKNDFSLFKDLFKLGSYLGIHFQILDDYDDFKNGEKVSSNIFVRDESKALNLLNLYEMRIKKICETYDLNETMIFLKNRFGP